MRAASLRHFGILSDTTRTSFLSASKFAVKMTWCPSCPFTASGLRMVQLLPSIVLTNVLPVSLIVPVTRTSFLESSAFISSWFVVSCAEDTPKVSRGTAKQTASIMSSCCSPALPRICKKQITTGVGGCLFTIAQFGIIEFCSRRRCRLTPLGSFSEQVCAYTRASPQFGTEIGGFCAARNPASSLAVNCLGLRPRSIPNQYPPSSSLSVIPDFIPISRYLL